MKRSSPVKCTSFEIVIMNASNYPKTDLIGHSDPYIIFYFTDGGYEKQYKTHHIKNTSSPQWNEVIRVADLHRDFTIHCYDKDALKKDDHVGVVKGFFPNITTKQTLTFNVVLDEKYRNKRPDNEKETTITFRFTPV